MKKLQRTALLCTALGLVAMATPSFAADESAASGRNSPWQLRLRAIDVAPQESSTLSISDKAKVDNNIVPELDISYFFTDHIAAELILATTKHHVTTKNGLDLGTAWVLPPTLTVQYHFMPDNAFAPYVGAGVNYTMYYNEDNGASVNKLQLKNDVGLALQAGFDYWLNDNWGLNLDVKKIYVDSDASVNSNTINGDVHLNPWVVGAGVSYRF
jgi:outer membrane protein